jgi:hypothetical protein
LLTLIATAGCATRYDLDGWRAVAETPRAESDRGDLVAELARVEELRAGLDLTGSRKVALTLAAEHPDDPAVLFAASRAECDEVFLAHTHEKEFRALAALSALDYARRMRAAAGATADDHPDWLAQFAFAMGTSTHLQPMFSRAGHASATAELIDRTLALDPAQPVALATGALLNYRLQTLPWIANVMSVGEPASSMERAEELARAAVAQVPSLEHTLILAKILKSTGRAQEARALLADVLARVDAFPRDAELRGDANALVSAIDEAAVSAAAE